MVFSMGNLLGIHAFLMLMNVFAVISSDGGEDSNILCLRLIKGSFQDPFGHLSTWNFSDTRPETVCTFAGIQCWQGNEVLTISLVNMGLIGQFPRGVEYCGRLESLDLSRNNLSGFIPADISHKLKYITFLDLSFNQFSGAIPPDIARCQYLFFLNLTNNQLQGPVPSQIGLMPRLKTFNVSNNTLTGPLPVFWYSAFPDDSFDDNPGLCGNPLSPCSITIVYVMNPIVEVFFKGFGIGWAFSFTLVTVFCSYFGIPNLPMLISMRRRNKGTKKDAMRGSQLIEPTMISNLDKYVTRISFQELANLTSNFCHENLVGFGKNGIMYKAFAPNGCSLAIKKLYASRNSDNDRFVSEVLSLGTQRHPNLLPLMGFCIEKDKRFLIYKYMSNGTLYNCLHRRREGSIMEWPLRMKISIGVANGLAWLHHSSRVRILHCNVNSRCILLDHNFEPRISNFWEAKFMNQAGVGSSSSLMSTSPADDCYNEKDVYSFGLILLELITGREWRRADLEEKGIPNGLRGQRIFDKMMVQFYGVAKDCVNPQAEQRPTMLQVCKRLEEIKLSFKNAGDNDINCN